MKKERFHNQIVLRYFQLESFILFIHINIHVYRFLIFCFHLFYDVWVLFNNGALFLSWTSMGNEVSKILTFVEKFYELKMKPMKYLSKENEFMKFWRWHMYRRWRTGVLNISFNFVWNIIFISSAILEVTVRYFSFLLFLQ